MAFAELQDDGRYIIQPSTDDEARAMRARRYPQAPVSREYAALILAAYDRADESALMAELYRKGYR